MTLFIAWVVFPVVLGLLCLGCALALERAAGISLPAPLLLPLGWVVLSLVTQATAMIGFTTGLAMPAAVLVALAGFAMSYPWRRRGVERPLVLAGLGVFAVYAAPIVLSGGAAFAGYIKLDDTATYFAMLDRAIAHGYNVSGLGPSTYEATLQTSLVLGYPLGTLLPLGVGRILVQQDLAWVWQPYLTFLVLLLGLGLYQLVSRIVASPWLRAIIAFGGAQSAIYFGYAMWGGIKELAAGALIVLIAALVPLTLEKEAPPRTIIPLAAACAAMLGAISVGGAVWLAPLLAGALAITIRKRGLNGLGRSVGWFAGAGILLAIPAAAAGNVWLNHTGSFTGSTEFGNLARKLNNLQVFGVWLNEDFRVPPHSLTLTYLFVAIVAVAALAGLAEAVRRDLWELPLAVVAGIFGCIVYVGAGSPWVGGKSLASASPVILTAGLTGAAIAFERRRELGVAIGALLLVGVVWSNLLQYHAVALSPPGVLKELAYAGDRFSGQGPALLTDFQSYGARHFLRTMEPEAAAELRRHNDYMNNGQFAPDATSIDIDELQLSGVLYYRTLVLRRSALASRPPSIYSLIWSGKYTEVWQRPDTTSTILEHLTLGTRFVPGAVPPCSEVERLAGIAAEGGGLLAAVKRPATIVLRTDGTPGPPTVASLGSYGEDPHALYLNKAYRIQLNFTAPADGTYGVWVGGTSVATTTISIDGRKVGSKAGTLNWPATYFELGSVQLTKGSHTLLFEYSGPQLGPGTGGPAQFATGPIALGIGTADQPVTYIEPSQAKTLCGQNLDWIEALRG